MITRLIEMNRIFATISTSIVLWLLLSLIPLGYYLHVSDKAYQFFITRLEDQGLQFLSYVDSKAKRTHIQVQQTFYQLSNSTLLNDFTLNHNPQYRHYLESQWYLTSFNSTLFYQLRFIDNQGHEVIRVDYLPNMSNPYIASGIELQDKSDRDYFIYAQTLANGEQGYFGIDLEFEHGKPVTPYRPGYRIIYPIVADSVRQGYFVANLDVLAIIEQITSNTQNLNVDFVDKHGYYVISSDKNKLFGDVIQERNDHNLITERNQVWQDIQKNPGKAGSILTNDGLFIYQPFNSQLFGTTNTLTMLTYYPSKVIAALFKARSTQLKTEALIIWLCVGLVSIILSVLWAGYRRIKTDQTYAEYVMENSVAVAITDKNMRILRANTSFSNLVKIDINKLVNTNIIDLFPSKSKQTLIQRQLSIRGIWQGNFSLQTSDNQEVVCQTEIHSILGQLRQIQYYVYSFTDISEHHNTILSLRERSERDPATSLWNKKKFEQSLYHQCRLKQRYSDHPTCCLAIMDVDSFKEINDTFGHKVGDEVIHYVANQLRAFLRDTDFIARIGGDEFAVLIQHTDIEQASNLIKRVCTEINNWTQHEVTLSVGLAEVTPDEEETFSHADQAMYQSKRKGKNCVSMYENEQKSSPYVPK